MIIILLLAALISFVVACVEQNPNEFFEPALILLIVIINAVMGVAQESKAEKAVEALQKMSAATTKTLRDGKIVSIKEETCVIETSHERTKIRILKTAVSRVDVKAEDAE